MSAELPVRLIRILRGGSHLRFEPVQLCGCGGELEVRDYLSSMSRTPTSREMRYECYCMRCGTCDPNGWSSQRKVIKKSVVGYFDFHFITLCQKNL